MANDRRDFQLEAWRELHDSLGAKQKPRRRTSVRRKDLRILLLAVAGLAVLVAPLAVAQNGDRPIRLGERNPSQGAGATEETAIVANVGNNGQATRQSNAAAGGRAAGYGCENDGTEEINACANYVNRGEGPAAAFRTRGSVPFAIRDTNRGRVANLNADLLDDREAADFLLRTDKAADSEKLDGLEPTAFLLKTEKAADSDKLDGLEPAEIGRELFANVDTNGAAQPTLGSTNGATDAIRVNAGNYRVDFGERDLTNCSYQVSSGEFNENQSTQVELDATDNSQLAVSIHDADAGTNVDGDFNVAALC